MSIQRMIIQLSPRHKQGNREIEYNGWDFIVEDVLKKLFRSYLFLLAIAVPVIALDQWTKAIVRANLTIGQMWAPWEWLTPYARIVHWYNTGVAFGMFQDANLLFSILAIIVSLGILFYFPRVEANETVLRVALSMQLGGAVGNLLDRIFVGHVTDFISVGTFPVFNIADSSITLGVAVLLIGIWVQERQEKKAREQDPLTEINGPSA